MCRCMWFWYSSTVQYPRRPVISAKLQQLCSVSREFPTFFPQLYSPLPPPARHYKVSQDRLHPNSITKCQLIIPPDSSHRACFYQQYTHRI